MAAKPYAETERSQAQKIIAYLLRNATDKWIR